MDVEKIAYKQVPVPVMLAAITARKQVSESAWNFSFIYSIFSGLAQGCGKEGCKCEDCKCTPGECSCEKSS